MSEFSGDIFDGLNESQIEAVKATEGYYRIIAGAGSGKTKTLTHRFSYLVNFLGIDARNILCVTFTNKAAAEMKKRVKELLGDGFDNALITTYHGFCVRVLREDINSLFFPENFKILDIGDQKRILEDIYAEFKLKLDYNTIENILSFIQEEKAHLKYIEPLTDPQFSFNIDTAMDMNGKIYQRYLAVQKKLYGLDFNDLLYFVLHLFGTNETVLKKWKNRLHYIQVDEFQDSSKKEMDLINFLCTGNDNLFVVGDPDQNIYEWRHSRNSFLVKFDKNYPDVKTIFLNRNYRSTPEILDASNNLIEKNADRIKKFLYTENEHGNKPEYFHCKNETEEEKHMAEKIASLLRAGYNYGDIAILYRSVNVSRFVEQALAKNDIPYQIYGGIRFFDRSEIRDAIAFLKLVYLNDDASFLRIINMPRRGIGKTKISVLRSIQRRLYEENGEILHLFDILRQSVEEEAFKNTGAAKFVSVIDEFRNSSKERKISDTLNMLLESLNYKAYIVQNGDMERFDNLAELINSIEAFEKSYDEPVSAEEYLQQVALMSDYESEKNRNTVRLMTAHAAKGLEFPCVIIAGLTDGIFPSKRALEDRKEEALEEERRLFYVAMTRAKKELIFFESEGSEQNNTAKLPSRFLFDIDEKYLKINGTIPDEIKKLITIRAKSLFAHTADKTELLRNGAKFFGEGDKVSHIVFGEGEIVEVNLADFTYMIKFAAAKNPKPISMKYQGLKPAGQNAPEHTAPPANEIIAHIEKPAENFIDISSAPDLSSVFGESDGLPDFSDADPDTKSKFTTPLKQNENTGTIPPLEEKKENENASLEIDRFMAEAEIDFFSGPATPAKAAAPEEPLTGEIIGDGNSGDPDEEDEAFGANQFEILMKKRHIFSLSGETKPYIYDNFDGKNLWNDSSFPKTVWVCVDVYDLGYPVATCGMCGQEDIRYLHIMKHKTDGYTLGVGCVCAEKLEGGAGAAKERENGIKNKTNRLTSFLRKKLKTSAKGNLYIKYNEILIIFIKNAKGQWCFLAENVYSVRYDTLEEAKFYAFLKYDKSDNKGE